MLFIFFKQKTAYEMRISDWSSDVCSSDLAHALVERLARRRQDEHADSIGHLLAHLARALPVDLQQHVAALGQPRFHRLDRRALPVAVHQRMLEEVAGIDHAREFLARNEVVVLGVALRSEEHTSELQSLMRISY